MLRQQPAEAGHPVLNSHFSQTMPRRGGIAGHHGPSEFLFQHLGHVGRAHRGAADDISVGVLVAVLECERLPPLRGSAVFLVNPREPGLPNFET